jgi:hypothetical protein
MDMPDPDVVAPLNTSSTIDPIGVVASSPELVIIGPDAQVDREAVVVVAPGDPVVVTNVSPAIVAIFTVSPTVLAASVAADELAARGPSNVAARMCTMVLPVVHRC